MWGILQVKTPRRCSDKGTPTLCKFHLQEFYQCCTVNDREKSPYSSGRGRKKLTILKYTRAFCSILPETNLIGFYQNLIHTGKGKYRLQPTLTILSKLNRRKKKNQLRDTGTFHSPGHCLTKRLRPNHKTIMLSLSLPLITILLKAYLRQFLQPSTSCPPVHQKLQSILKGKKYSLKRMNIYQNHRYGTNVAITMHFFKP